MKSTRKSLLACTLALLLCFAMLLGTTYAWFTDSAVSSGNKIVAGTLDVQLFLHTSETDKVEITELSAPVFGAEDSIIAQNNNANTLWEPGKTQTAYFSIYNAGNLDLKYKVQIEVKNPTTHNLLDVLEYKITPDATYGTADKWVNGTGTKVDLGFNSTEATDVKLGKGETHNFALSIHMLKEATNEYMGESIEFDIIVLAGQDASESDSFDNQYDGDANYQTSAATLNEFFNALDSGDNVTLTEQLVIDDSFVDYMNERYGSTTYAMRKVSTVIDRDANIDGGGVTIHRSEDMIGKPLFIVKKGFTLTLSNITLDGGARWTGDIDPTLLRGTENAGIKTSSAVITTEGNGSIVLNEGAVVQNNDGAIAIYLFKAGGGTLTINGGHVINNNANGGAIWAGGKIVINEGSKINSNSSTGIAGAIRVVSTMGSLTMNGGEINHNKAGSDGGAIWGGNNCSYYFNGGEIAYNEAVSRGGAIWAGSGEKYYVSGDFEMHHNKAGVYGNAIRFTENNYTQFNMTGGHIYANDAQSGVCGIFANNNYLNLHGGKIEDDIIYTGNLFLTVGKTEITGVVKFDNGTRGDNKILLGEEIAGMKFLVDVNDPLFDIFMLDPADGYTYTEGDEDKLVCLNEGYETYWDEATSTFRLREVQ